MAHLKSHWRFSVMHQARNSQLDQDKTQQTKPIKTNSDRPSNKLTNRTTKPDHTQSNQTKPNRSTNRLLIIDQPTNQLINQLTNHPSNPANQTQPEQTTPIQNRTKTEPRPNRNRTQPPLTSKGQKLQRYAPPSYGRRSWRGGARKATRGLSLPPLPRPRHHSHSHFRSHFHSPIDRRCSVPPVKVEVSWPKTKYEKNIKGGASAQKRYTTLSLLEQNKLPH